MQLFLIYLFLSALHVSGDSFAYHQEHNCTYIFGYLFMLNPCIIINHTSVPAGALNS
jgi:hypothetical protein